MHQKGLAQNSITYSGAISAGEKVKQPHKAVELLAEMLQKGLAAKSIAYSAPSVLVEGQAASQGDEVPRRDAPARTGAKRLTYSTAISTWGQAKQPRKAIELLAARFWFAADSSSMVSRVVCCCLRRRTGPLESRGQQPVGLLTGCWPGTGKVPQVR